MKKLRFLSIFLILLTLASSFTAVSAAEQGAEMSIESKSAILMDATTGEVIYEKNSHMRLHPASVTKVMTLLLVFEAIENGSLTYDEILTCSENASSMGGSQIFLEPGEQMSVDDLLKSVIVVSANDAALTLAEHVAGSEEQFVSNMNKRAEELGMKNTHFENVTGLDDDTVDHLTTANDIALMSRELLKHEKVSEYATIWMDTVRNGEFGLSNTNKLVRFYKGITGLKTGFTQKAGYCISASAKRDNMHLIAVIMGAESSSVRNANASKLLDYGFANYSLYKNDTTELGEMKIYGGNEEMIHISCDEFQSLLKKGQADKVTVRNELPEKIKAPINKGDIIGKRVYELNGEKIFEGNIYADEAVNGINFFDLVLRVIKIIF